MNKKTITIIIIATVAVLGAMVWGYSRMAGPVTKAQLVAKSSLAAAEMLYDFGTISMANGKVDHSFAITNPTDRDITIDNLQTSCMCTTAYLVNGSDREGPFGMPGMGGSTAADHVIPAHATQAVDVVFDPAAHGPAGVGDIDRLIYATEKDGGTLQLEIKAVVTP
jgi:hypothetical protein